MESGGLRTRGIIKQSEDNFPLITVITINFNNANALKETIESVINQTYQNIEYILIDGGSTDNSLEVIKQYEDRIDYWISEPDEGMFYAMNKGVDLSTGKWINLMNSSDKFCDDTVTEKIFISNKEYKDIIYGNTIYIIGESRIFCYPNINDIKKRYPFRHQSCFVEAHLMKKFKFNTKYKSADYDLFYRLYIYGCIFMYSDVTISECDVNDGYSVKHPVYFALEFIQIRSEKLNINTILYILYSGLNQIINNVFPQKLFSFIKKGTLEKKARRNEIALKNSANYPTHFELKNK
jgi:glycosyltransferase involved in cell wall biosynthesis